MSSIPNKAMPHAQAENLNEDPSAETSGGALSQLADKAREYPKTAIAAGAAVAAGVAAAAVLGTRGRSGSGGGKSRKGKNA
jgi:hypothetical protein